MSEAAIRQAAADRRALSQRDVNRTLLSVLGAGLLTLAVLAVAIVWLSIQTKQFNGWVDHTYLAEQRIVAFMEAVEKSETARRGYILAPTARQYATYQEARADVSGRLFAAAETTKDNPVQVANISRIRPILLWKMKVNDDSVAAVKSGRQSEALRDFPAEQELQPLLGLRKLADDMLDQEQQLLAQRTRQEQDSIRLLVAVGLATAVLLALLSLSSVLVMRRFASDLTKAQAELKALNDDLEQRVEARTTDLTRANQEIQRFAYIVSHDLRSPLVNVMGFTSEMEASMKPLHALVRWIEERDPEGRMPAEVKQAVDVDIPEAIGFIRSSTKKMDSLIGAILKLSREGRRNLAPERLPMAPLVENILATVRHRLDELGGEAKIDGHLPDITSDRLAVEQVLGNLIDNAVKYHSSKRPLHISISGTELGNRVVYEVRDNGRGIDPRDHERIFELFRRSGAQTQPGEGIGLAHVRALVHRLGGTITCVSALDGGAVFRISLPKVLVLTEGLNA
jgi:signal transduction histidine kinase